MNASNLKAEKLRFLYAGLPLQLTVAVFSAVIMTSVHWTLVPRGLLLAWLVVLNVTILGRMLLAIWFRRALRRAVNINALPVAIWLRRFRLSSLAGGLAWGLGSLILCQSGNPVYQAFVAFTMAGVSAGAITALAIDRAATLLFVTPMLAPLSAFFLLGSSPLSLVIGLIVLLFLLFLAIAAARIERYLHDNVHLRLQAEAQKRLIQTNETRLRFALEGTGQGLWDWDIETGQVFYSPQWKAILGYPDDQIGTTRDEWKSRIHPDDWEMVAAALKRHSDGASLRYEAEHRLRCRDGRFKWVLDHGIIIERTAAGKPKRMIGLHLDINERKVAETAIQNLAFYDPLTKLPNRRLLLDRLHHALAISERSRRFGGLLFIDLDRFKELNDSCGHAIGDLLLQDVAQRLCQSVRNLDTVARFAGDEFVVMLEELTEDNGEAEQFAAEIARKILVKLGEPYHLAGNWHHATPSIGIVLFRGQRLNADELLCRADLAMYRAKQSGRNQVCFFDPSMQILVDTRTALKDDLRAGIEQGQFVLHYQPQINRAGDITGVEALLRWMNPQRVMVTTSDVIALAEESGLIIPLGYWVLETACQQLKQWSTQPDMAPLTLSVNISDRLFHDINFVDRVLTILDQTDANPHQLSLELKESLLSRDAARMERLKACGIRLSLDNFGAGYASLGALRNLPLDQLKLDQSIVSNLLTNPKSAAIARSIITLAEALGLEVIASGVETGEQRQFLETYSCHGFQGYFFSAPLTVQELQNTHLKHA